MTACKQRQVRGTMKRVALPALVLLGLCLCAESQTALPWIKVKSCLRSGCPHS